ncbi:hypothetical protein ACSNOI_42040 [Actinomadura kijaniata]|uniref:hypothetical protein n=1 Tax=Actinomadura kijaniata TaxID=46161 RepID=UPI003F1A27AB
MTEHHTIRAADGTEAAHEARLMLTAETNPLPVGGIGALLAQLDGDTRVMLDDPRLAQIVRLRLLGGVPCWEVSYCYDRLTDGRLVEVDLEVWRLRPNYRIHLRQLCHNAGRTAEELGLWDAVSTLPD